MTLAAADAPVVDAWFAALAAHVHRPAALPDGIEPVQVRMPRAVGRATLPAAGPVFVKVMTFPRPAHRLRYAFRSLPLAHEAAVLRRLAAHGDVPCPPVVAVRGDRGMAGPRRELLVLGSLGEPAPAPPDLASCARLAARLADLGLWHPDLHRGNFFAQPDGRVAVLDLQSARWRRAPLGTRARERMAVKLLAGPEPPDAGPLIAGGLLPAAAAGRVERAAAVERAADLRRQILRCLRSSTRFRVRRRWNGRLYERRDSSANDGVWLSAGADAVRWWIGDSAREFFDGEPPVLRALFRKSWWLPGLDAVYIPQSVAQVFRAEHAPRLLAGFERLRQSGDGRGFPSGPVTEPAHTRVGGND